MAGTSANSHFVPESRLVRGAKTRFLSLLDPPLDMLSCEKVVKDVHILCGFLCCISAIGGLFISYIFPFVGVRFSPLFFLKDAGFIHYETVLSISKVANIINKNNIITKYNTNPHSETLFCLFH